MANDNPLETVVWGEGEVPPRPAPSLQPWQKRAVTPTQPVGLFVPQAPYYTHVAGKQFASPAAAFMAEKLAERGGVPLEEYERAAARADEDARAIQSGTPRGASLLGLNAGEAKANEQNQRGFLSTLLGNVDWQGLLSVMARPEFLEPGVSPAVAFSKAAFGQRQAEAAAAAVRQQQMFELQKEMIKKTGIGAEKLTGPVLQVIESTSLASEGLKAINAYREILNASQVGGLAGKGEEALNAVASLFGFGTLTPAQKASAVRQKILASLQTARAKGQISASDYKNIEQQLGNPGEWFKSSDALFDQLNIVQSQLESKQQLGRNTLNYFGVNPQAVSAYRSPLTIGSRPD